MRLTCLVNHSRVSNAFVHLLIRLCPLLLALVVLFWPGKAQAGSPTCTISVTTIAFGSFDVLPGTAVNTTATITTSCSGGGGNGQRLCISMGSGANVSGSQRLLSGPGGVTLNYEIYRDAARTIPWGSWQTGFNTAGLQLDVSQNATTSTTIYGQVAAGQVTAVAGSYSTSFTANPYMQYADKGTSSCPTGNSSASASTSATATVNATCTITVSPLSFGATGSIAANMDAAAQFTPTCNNGLPYSIALDGGLASATDPTQRKMSKGAERITYGLYRDLSRSQPWGAAVGTNTQAGSGTGMAQTVSVYGRVAPQAVGSPGTYTDSVVVTVNF